MMATFRKLGNTKASKIFMTLLALSFVAWGVGGYLMHTSSLSVLSVNGEDVSIATFEQAYKARLQQLQQMLGGKIPPEQLAQLNIGQSVLNELTSRVAMRTTAEHLGLVAATRQLQDEIMGMRVFSNESGAFDAARYRQLLAQNGRTPEQFEHDLGRDMAVRNLAQIVALPALEAGTAAPQVQLEEATLKLDVATLTPAVVGPLPTPSQAQLEVFYKENESLYVRPETRDIGTLTLKREDIAKSIVVSEDRIAEEFNANKAAYAAPETRTVRHILVETEDAAKALAPKIKTLADLETLAKTESKDPGSSAKGGLLGDIAQKDVVETFGKEAFSLPVGKLSAPVKSPFGWHLIWVEKITPGKERTLADVKADISAQLRDAEADETLASLAKKVDEMVAGGSTLAEIAKATGLKLQTMASLKATDEAMPAPLMEAAFATPKGRIASPLTLEDGSTVYVEVSKATSAQLPPLAEMKDRVEKDWKQAQLQSALQQRAAQLAAILRAPGNVSMQAAVSKLKLQGINLSTMELKRLDSVPQWLQPQLLNIYPLPVGATLPAALPEGDQIHIVRLAERVPATLGAADLQGAAKVYNQRLQSDVEGLILNYLVQTAKVKANQQRIDQVVGALSKSEK